ncbi:hypothetical protein Purlil1_6127 [Purpureocillium lilacinum]|uniref:Uncharacterized protein n=1 Tax=Purpureocillium lilacinum TaxID=33203 RepID=A0ABR0C0W6_PURLI|nr:hypothetical protein Purlil1_6127 [Purpureocillium lilacinum]
MSEMGRSAHSTVDVTDAKRGNDIGAALTAELRKRSSANGDSVAVTGTWKPWLAGWQWIGACPPRGGPGRQQGVPLQRMQAGKPWQPSPSRAAPGHSGGGFGGGRLDGNFWGGANGTDKRSVHWVRHQVGTPPNTGGR